MKFMRFFTQWIILTSKKHWYCMYNNRLTKRIILNLFLEVDRTVFFFSKWENLCRIKKYKLFVFLTIRPHFRPLLMNRPIMVQIRGITIMNDDPTQTRILFAKLESPNDILQRLADEVHNFFLRDGNKTLLRHYAMVYIRHSLFSNMNSFTQV